MLDINKLLTSSGKYPERAKNPDLTPELRANGEDLVKRVNNLLMEISKADITVSSGFRPAAINSGIPNAAKKSLHMSCKAVDIADPTGALAKMILANVDSKCNSSDDVLTKYGLWLESPDSTPGWVHLDTGMRTVRKRRVFIP